ncbi:hypothetical protein [Streptomyces sp. H27-D2]|uniref:hypothetical protein n=1 Tax=Streptomyces sp. H27-D2 TaxID=3046304 RepID=UPI002DB8BEBE|nr:hypothetical protein [Streptomyces sp. H27-D2]MEC4016128.1 hypothetical protein [Streptomyces sp. H27-D2]
MSKHYGPRVPQNLPLVCTCAHVRSEHDDVCSGRDSYGLACECLSFEIDRYWSGLDSERTPPRPEAVAAADWWALQLAQPPVHGIGAQEQSDFANAATAVSRKPKTPEQIDDFRVALAEMIERKLSKRPEDWRPDNPSWASAFRTIAGDYRPAQELETAAEQAGFQLKMFDVPMKTVMWINPGIVRVAVGHGGIDEVVWQEAQ